MRLRSVPATRLHVRLVALAVIVLASIAPAAEARGLPLRDAR